MPDDYALPVLAEYSLNPADIKLRSPHSPTGSGKPRPIRVLLRLHHHAPRARATILSRVPPGLQHRVILQTTPGGMQRHLVVRVQVDALDDVDFAVVGPERTLRPECRPDGAAVRNMHEIDDPEAAIVVEV